MSSPEGGPSEDVPSGEVPSEVVEAPPRARRDRWIRRCFSPLTVLLVAGTVAGLFLALGTPRLSGIDEMPHFARAYQISEGTLAPVDPPDGVEGVGVCLPADVRDDLQRQLERNLFGGLIDPESDTYRGIPCERRDPRDGKYVEIATFSWYSPVGYAPEAVAVLAGRVVGLSPLDLTIAARLAALSTYLAIAGVAVATATRVRWTMVVVALLPVSLLQASMSTGPDAIVISLTLLVVSSVLRLTDAAHVSTTRFVVEAGGLGVALALAKPLYGLAAVAYLLPLWRHRGVGRGPGVFAALGPLTVSTLYYRVRSSVFLCDVRHFNIQPDASRQFDRLLQQPFDVVVVLGDALDRYGAEWVQRLALVNERTFAARQGPSVSIGVALLVGGGLLTILAGAARDRSAPPPLLGRLAFAPIGLVVTLAVVAAWLIYCNPPRMEILWPPHVRLFVPGLALLLVAISGSVRWLRVRWLPLGLVPYLAGVAWGVASIVAHPI